MANSAPMVKWILHYNGTLQSFDKLNDLAQFIPTESEQNSRIPPSEYDKSPLLLICLPKHVQSKKTEKEISEEELLRKRPQIFDPPKDLQWYHSKLEIVYNLLLCSNRIKKNLIYLLHRFIT